ncbi:hypothetical protein DXG03_000955 [Asterophora parasitica]|uniref:Oxidoreductase n=1 Tax=Asterophora parasitica TaxID=117018 RepID=A0A9P7G3J8_9AGAR|nr:hypothetical protein DXG03_000955 [Asterophora parasitica]
MSSSQSGVAILGAGLFAKEDLRISQSHRDTAHIPALALLSASAPPLKAVYSRSAKSAQDFANFSVGALSLVSAPSVYYDSPNNEKSDTDLDALLARMDITALVIALPIVTQPDIVLRALAAGKHVLSEKPVAPTVAEGLVLIRTYNEVYKPKGLVWRIAENFEAEPGFRKAAEKIREGAIGKVIFFRSVVYNWIDESSKWYKTPWRTVPDYQGGFLLDGGVHTTAALRVLLPGPLMHLTGFASLNKSYLAPHDTIHALIRSSGDFHGTLEITFASPTRERPVADGFVITGTKGWLSINQAASTVDGKETQVFRVKIHSVGPKQKGLDDATQEEPTEVFEEPIKGVEVELAAFFEAIERKEGILEIGEPLEALRDVAVIEAALTSQGKLVDLIELVPTSL